MLLKLILHALQVDGQNYLSIYYLLILRYLSCWALPVADLNQMLNQFCTGTYLND